MLTGLTDEFTFAVGNNYYNGPDVWRGLGAGGIAAIVIAILVLAFAVFLFARSRKGPGPMG